MKKSILILLLSGSLFALSPINQQASEDELIVRALIAQEFKKYDLSAQIWHRLYEKSKKIEYLLEEIKDTKDIDRAIAKLQDWLKKNPKGDKRVFRTLVGLYLIKGDLTKAKLAADKYLSNSDDVEDLKVLELLYMKIKDYDTLLKILDKIYEKNHDDKVLLEKATILDKYLNKRKEAIALLEDAIRKNPDASIAIYFKLIELYAKNDNLDKVLELYKELYKKDPQKYFLEKIIKLSIYKNDLDSAIEVLEASHEDDNFLYALYKEKGYFDKAMALAKKLYKKSNDPKWFAEEAILTYEKARLSHKVTPQVIEKMRALFEEAIKRGVDDPLYLNYYGYTLIDHDLDVEKGVELVKKALKKDPDNPYYLDSLAWGYFKLGKCKRAYRIMQKVIAIEGLKEKEIKLHWESIRDCNKKIKSQK